MRSMIVTSTGAEHDALAHKALVQLVGRHAHLSDIRARHSGSLSFEVVGERYHDCDRAPSYTSTDIIMSGLGRIEADSLVKLLQGEGRS